MLFNFLEPAICCWTKLNPRHVYISNSSISKSFLKANFWHKEPLFYNNVALATSVDSQKLHEVRSPSLSLSFRVTHMFSLTNSTFTKLVYKGKEMPIVQRYKWDHTCVQFWSFSFRNYVMSWKWHRQDSKSCYWDWRAWVIRIDGMGWGFLSLQRGRLSWGMTY